MGVAKKEERVTNQQPVTSRKSENYSRPIYAPDNFKAIAQVMPVPMTIHRVADEKIIFCNHAFEDLLDTTANDVRGRHVSHLFTSVSDRRKMKQKLAVDGKFWGFELQSRRRTGDTVWILAFLQRMVYRGQECVISIMADITKRRRAEEQLRQKQSDLQELLDLSDYDRQLIAYEIHDGVVQDMTGALLHLQAAEHAIDKNQEVLVKQLETGIQLIRKGISEARHLIDGVRPPDLEQLGIAAAIERLAAEVQERTSMRVEFTHNIQFVRLLSQLENGIYRIIQEAINNAHRHGQTDKIRIELSQHDLELELSIRDWGVGFVPEEVPTGCYGLQGISKRVRLLNGESCIESKPGLGTCITIVLPLVEAQRDPQEQTSC